MTSNALHAVPLLFFLCAACSGNASNSAVPAAIKTPGTATALTAAPDVRGSVRALTARGPENVEFSAGPVPGSRLMHIRAGYSEVIVAKTNSDGTFSTRCVDTEEGADAFLNSSSPSSPTKAAQ